MKKKILSLVTIAAMAFSTMSSFMVAHAETAKPTIEYVFDFVNDGTTFDDSYDAFWDNDSLEGAPVYKITLSIAGFTKKAAVKENGATVAYTGAVIEGIEGVAAKVETSKEYMILAEEKNWTNGTAVIGSDIEKDKLAYAWGGAKSSEYIKEPTMLATWVIMATDGTEITDLKITLHEDANLGTKFAEVYDGTDKTGEKGVMATSNVFVGYGDEPTPDPEPEVPTAQSVQTSVFEPAVGDYVEVTLTDAKGTQKGDSVKFSLPDNVKGKATKVLGFLKYTIGVAGEGREAPAAGDILTAVLMNLTEGAKATIATETVK